MKIDTTADGYGTGLGDMVALSWIAEGTKNTKNPIIFHATEKNKIVLEMLGQTVVSESGGITIHNAYQLELEDFGINSTRTGYIQKVLNINTPIVRPQVHIENKYIEEADKINTEVMLFPQTNSTCMQWPAAYWVELSHQLLNLNIPTTTWLTHLDHRFKHMPNYYYGYDLRIVASIMQRSKLIVGNDSFSIHLGGTLNKKSMVLCGITNPKCTFGYLDSVIGLYSEEEPGCAMCAYSTEKYRAACIQGCQMLYALKPHHVVEAIQKELGFL